MKKRALVFIDDGVVKIVIGSIMKVVRIEELSAQHNLAFFDRMFEESDVLVVESVSTIGRDGFADMLKSYGTSPRAMAQAQEASASRMPMTSPGPQAIPAMDEGIFYKSNAITHITIDDLPTGGELFPGCPKCVSVAPGEAINLSLVDSEVVRKSRILQRLIANGTLEPISSQEAARLEARAAQQAMAIEKDNSSRSASPILQTTVDNFMAGSAPNAPPDRDFVPTEVEEPKGSAQGDFDTENWGFKSLNDFLRAREEAPDEPQAASTPSSIMARPRATNLSGVTAKGIARK